MVDVPLHHFDQQTFSAFESGDLIPVVRQRRFHFD